MLKEKLADGTAGSLSALYLSSSLLAGQSQVHTLKILMFVLTDVY